MFAIGALVPILIRNLIIQKVTDQLAVPPPDAEPWRLSNWANNTNSSVHPVQYTRVSFYHVLNPAAIVRGETPQVERML
jgi:hypothetical protein